MGGLAGQKKTDGTEGEAEYFFLPRYVRRQDIPVDAPINLPTMPETFFDGVPNMPKHTIIRMGAAHWDARIPTAEGVLHFDFRSMSRDERHGRR